MIILDTHIWIWWVDGSDRLSAAQRNAIMGHTEIGVSAISCWEVSKLVEKSRLTLDRPTLDWLQLALLYPNVRLLDLSPEVAAASASLPGSFHRDPADQILTATARLNDCSLVTSDQKIIDYTHVRTIS